MKLRKRVISVILAGIVCAGIPVQARGAEAEDTEKDYVVWDLGRGVTLKTAASGQDHFETYESGITLQPAGQNEQVENYYLKNGGEEVFGAPAGMTYITNTGILFREYEKAMIVTGNYGTYSIQLPLLNVFAEEELKASARPWESRSEVWEKHTRLLKKEPCVSATRI